MSDHFTMPVLGKPIAGLPRSFTWAPTLAHRAWAQSNHGQSLERLRERGGLGWTELHAVLFGVRWINIKLREADAAKIVLEAFPQEASACGG